MKEKIEKLQDRTWHWILVDGYDWHMPCLLMKDEEDPESSCFLPAGLGDSSSMGIFLDDIEEIGPQIEPPRK